jgi:Rrf2 family transcriptional regulator, cysteine metabolism repressor
MRLSLASSYAVTALVYLVREKPEAPVAAIKMARVEGLPAQFLRTLLKPLVGAGILRSVRGPKGGYSLARAATGITLLEVVEAVDGPLRAMVVPVNKEGAALDKRLQAICDETLALVRDRLAKVTLAELPRGK